MLAPVELAAPVEPTVPPVALEFDELVADEPHPVAETESVELPIEAAQH